MSIPTGMVLVSGQPAKDIIASVIEFAHGETNGQLRRDCHERYHDLFAVQFGQKNEELNEADRKKLRAIRVEDIYLDEKGRKEAYTIVRQWYVDFLRDCFGSPADACWFLPAAGYWNWELHDATVSIALDYIAGNWEYIYEFIIIAKDMTWLVEYEHHHNMYIYGDREASRARNLAKRRKHVDRILYCDNFVATSRKS